MKEYEELMDVLDSDDAGTVLYHLSNDLFDTVVLVYHDGDANEEAYTLTDMQGCYPETLDEVPEYEWVLAEQIDF